METSPKPVVLVVDDDADFARMMQMALNHVGFDAHAAFSGQQALDWLKSRLPDAILLDLMLPDVDGFTLLGQMRADERTGHLPVVMLTARLEGRVREQALDAGADAFFTKPAPTAKLLEQLRALLARQEEPGPEMRDE